MNRKWPVDKDPLGYGFGDHRCIAELLANTELTTVFGMLPHGAHHIEHSPVLHALIQSRAATLFQKLPGLTLTQRPELVKCTPLHKDVGIVELPVRF